MTKEEFIKKHSPFILDQSSNKMLTEWHTGINGKMYNHGFYLNEINPNEIEHDWDKISSNKEFMEYIMRLLKDSCFHSKLSYPYRPFILQNFQYEKGNFLNAFFKAIGISLKSPESVHEIQLKPISMSESIFEMKKNSCNYYSANNKNNSRQHLQAERFMKIYLKNIKRITFHNSSAFQELLPVFFLGETLIGNSLVGLFSIGLFDAVSENNKTLPSSYIEKIALAKF